MKSTTGEHYIALDHVRALAAFIVVCYHFIHATGLDWAYVPPLLLFPASIIDEGHVGVAIFMVLSGYLFAKLLNGRKLFIGRFFFNRALRLFPLLVSVIVVQALIRGVEGGDPWAYLSAAPLGFIFPTFPNGGWSVTVELHFYILLPVLLFAAGKNIQWLLAILLLAICFRFAIWRMGYFDIRELSYSTIIGRIDQFVLGMIAYHLRERFQHMRWRSAIPLVGFGLFYWWFDHSGGFFQRDTVEARSYIWVILPTIEALFIAALIATYDQADLKLNGKVSRLIAHVGTWSFSLYLLHPFFFGWAAKLMPTSNFYLSCLLAIAFFLAMLPISAAGFYFVERPFLSFRLKYVKASESKVHPAPEIGASNRQALADAPP